MSIRIDGLSRLSEMLTNIAPTKAKRKMREALSEGADVVQNAAEESAPVYIGYLEESIVQKGSWESGEGTTTLTVDIGPTKKAFWGMFQEFGTQDVSGTTKKGKPFHHTAQPAQHWLTRSWEGSRDEVLDTIKNEMTALIVELDNTR